MSQINNSISLIYISDSIISGGVWILNSFDAEILSYSLPLVTEELDKNMFLAWSFNSLFESRFNEIKELNNNEYRNMIINELLS